MPVVKTLSKPNEFAVHDAKREPVEATILLAGPSGGGKTYSALLLASGMGKNVVLIDTEKKPATLYANEFKFKRIVLSSPFTPERYASAIKAAMELKPDVLIIDSATHEWMGKGGILQEKDNMPGANDYIKWKDLTPRHDRYVERLVSQKCHTITCVRAKERFDMVETVNKDGKKVSAPRRIGLRPIQRRDFMYDFMISFTLDPDKHIARLLNSSASIFHEFEPHLLTKKDGEAIALWARQGGKSK